MGGTIAIVTHVVLIGPIGVGKSSVAPVVGRALGRPIIELDELRSDVYATLGYDNAKADELYRLGGIEGLMSYWKPFELELVEHAVALEPGAVLDFGAGHSHFDDEEQFRRASAALAGHYVVLLLPSLDVEESERILDARQPSEHRAASRELNATFLSSRSNALLADRVLITGDRSPEDIATDLVQGWREKLGR
jgi:shikimate kinase